MGIRSGDESGNHGPLDGTRPTHFRLARHSVHPEPVAQVAPRMRVPPSAPVPSAAGQKGSASGLSRRRFLLAGGWALALGRGHAAALRRIELATLSLTDLDGKRVLLTPSPSVRALVFVFLGVECPIANRCSPELVRLARDLTPRGIRFYHVYPNPDETPEVIRRHREAYAYPAEAYRDPDLKLARALGARWTPEAVALTPDGSRIYQGRINDQFTALGVGRPAPTRHELAEALEAYLHGGPPLGIVTPRAGCTFRGPEP